VITTAMLMIMMVGLGQSDSNPGEVRAYCVVAGGGASLELAMLRPDVDQRSIGSLASTPNTVFPVSRWMDDGLPS
jgi:hypothetical protein